MNALGRVLSALSLSTRCFSLTAARPKRWTQEEVDQLEKMRSEGRSHKDIAAALGRTYCSIHTRIAQPRSTPPLRRTALRTREPWTQADVQTLKDASARGEPVASIARLLNRSTPSVERGLQRHVRPPHRSKLRHSRRKPWTQQEHDSATKLREHGCTYKAIGLIIGGKSRHNVRYRLSRAAANCGPGRFGHPLTEAEYAQIAQLHLCGKTIQQIHIAMPLRPYPTIYRAVKRLNDPTWTRGK